MDALDLSAALLEMYTLFRNRNDVDIEAESMAASAASVIAMAAHSTISPVGMLMIHCISTSRVSGNHQDMEKMAETLRAYDEALANAYVIKTGRSKEDIPDCSASFFWIHPISALALTMLFAMPQ